MIWLEKLSRRASTTGCTSSVTTGMNPYLQWALISICLCLPVFAEDKLEPELNGSNIKKVEIDLDLFGNEAFVEYDGTWKSKASVAYAQRKKTVAYRDEKNELCLLEKIQRQKTLRSLKRYGDVEYYSRLYVSSDTLQQDKAERIAGKRILQFCRNYPIILLEEHTVEDPQLTETASTEGAGRVKRETHGSLRGSESKISHQELSKKLLEDLANAESLVAGDVYTGKGVKRNADGRIESGRGSHPSASAKVGQPAAVDYHARIRNNLHPGARGMHPIDITSSVTITTGSSHPLWSYSPSAGSHYPSPLSYHNGTGNVHPSATSASHEIHHPPPSHYNMTHHAPAHGSEGGQHSPEGKSQMSHQGLHPHTPTSDQSFKGVGHFPPSSTSKTQDTPAHYQPSSSSKSHDSAYYPPSSGSKSQGPAYYPPSSTSKAQGPSHYPPSSTSKSQGPAYYPPSSTSKSQDSSHYPPSSTSKSQGSAYYPPSSTSKTQGPAYYPPSSTSKSQGPSHYPPSSTSKSQGPSHYPPSSTSKSQGPAYYPPSSTSKSQSPAYYPPSSTSKFQRGHSNITHSPSGGGLHSPTTEKLPAGGHYSPSAASTQFTQGHGTKFQHLPNLGHDSSYLPPSSSSKVYYPTPSEQNAHSLHPPVQANSVYAPQFPPSSATVTSPHGVRYDGKQVAPQHYPPSSFSKSHHVIHGGPHEQSRSAAHHPPSSFSNMHGRADHAGNAQFPQFSQFPSQFPPSSTSKVSTPPDSPNRHATVLERPSAKDTEPRGFPPSSTSRLHHTPQTPSSVPYYPPSSSSKNFYHPAANLEPASQYPPSSTSKLHYSPSSVTQSGGSPASQIPHPPTDRHFPPSSTSKSSPHHHHASTHHYPPSASSNAGHSLPHPQPLPAHHQHQHHTVPYHHPSGVPAQQNVSSHAGHPLSPGYYPPSSTSKLHHFAPSHQDAQVGGQHPAPGRTSHMSTHAAYYPPSSSTKNVIFDHSQGGHHQPNSHPPQQYPHLTPSHPAQNRTSVALGMAPTFMDHSSYMPPQFPPSSSSKLPSGMHENETEIGHPNVPEQRSLYPPSSIGQHYPPSATHHNDSVAGQHPHSAHRPEGHPAGTYHPHMGGSSYPQQYPPSSTSSLHPQPQRSSQPQIHQGLPPSGQGSTIPGRPCQSPPRSLYSITTRTIVSPNGVIQRPVSVKTNGEPPCGASSVPVVSYNGRYSPCSGTVRNGQATKSQPPCTANRNLRKAMRSVIVPGPAVMAPGRGSPYQTNMKGEGAETNLGNSRSHQHPEDFTNPEGVVITNVGESQTELLEGIGYRGHHAKFSKLRTEESDPGNSTSPGQKDVVPEEASAPEFPDENGKLEKDVEVFEGGDAENEQSQSKPLKYQEDHSGGKEVSRDDAKVEEEVREGDILEPGDRILGKDGYTISEGFRGRVVSVTGQVGKERADAGKEKTAKTQSTERKSNFGQFKYSSQLGRYVKETGEKSFSNCHGEPTFTCTEFLGSNGRAKICKPNPRRNPDGSPC